MRRALLAVVAVTTLSRGVTAVHAADVAAWPASTAAGSSQVLTASPPTTELSPETRRRLLASAADSTVAPWQRAIMLEMAGATPTGGAGLAGASAAPGEAGAVATDGVWTQESPPSARYLHAAVYDSAHDRMVVFGGYSTRDLVNDVWVLSLAGSPVWTQLTPVGVPPSARQLMSAVYDPVRNRIVVFGGLERSAVGYLDDVWALSLDATPTWNRITPTGIGPSARARHSAVYDPVRDRMIVFGGYHAGLRGADAGPLNDVWALSLSDAPQWTPLAPIGPTPSARYDQSAVYDVGRDRIVVFGGYGQTLLNDVWSLELRGRTRWQQLGPAGVLPAPRSEHAASFDPVGEQMVIFGGYTDARVGDTWSLSLHGRNVWTRIDAPSEPPVRWGHSAIYDPVRGRIVFYGGTPDGRGLLAEIWGLSLSGAANWTNLTPSSAPMARRGHSAIYDAARERMLVFGGYDEQAGNFLNDVWALALAGGPQWTMLHPSGTPPSPRADHAAIYDPVGDRMLAFGGQTDALGVSDEVWSLSLSGDPVWTQLTPSGSKPAARTSHTTIYDALNDRMVVFGGVNFTSYLSDTWALSLDGVPTWTQLTPSGTQPQARFEHSAIYDPVRKRMLVFGGLSMPYFFGDLWALSLDGSPAWTQITTKGIAPSVRAAHRAIYDSKRDRMLVFGGFSYTTPGPTTGQGPWSLSLGSSEWGLLEPSGTSPDGSSGHSAVYDPIGDRMLVFGGHGVSNDLWALGWGVAADQQASPVVGFPPPGPPGLASIQVSPNPSRTDVTIAFTLAEAGEAKVSIYDVAGRYVKTLADGVQPAGRRTFNWDRRTTSGALAQPGLYFCELQSGNRRSMRELVLVR